MTIRNCARLVQGKGTRTQPAQIPASLLSINDLIRHRLGRTLTLGRLRASTRWASIPNRLTCRLIGPGESQEW